MLRIASHSVSDIGLKMGAQKGYFKCFRLNVKIGCTKLYKHEKKKLQFLLKILNFLGFYTI